MRQLNDRNSVWGMTLNSSGSLLYTTGVSFLSKWDVQRGALIASAPVSERVTRLVLSVDEKSLILGASEQEGLLLRYDADTLELLEKIPAHSSFVKALLVLPRQDLLVSGSADSRVMVWHGSELRRLKTLSHHASWVWALAHTREENALFSGSSDRSIIEYSVPDFEKKKDLSLPEWVMSLTLAPDEQTLFAGGQTSVFVIDRHHLTLTTSFPVHKSSIWEIIVDSQNNALITCSNDHSLAITSLDQPHVQVSHTLHDDQVYALRRVGDLLISAACDKRIVILPLESSFRTLNQKLKAVKDISEPKKLRPETQISQETLETPIGSNAVQESRTHQESAEEAEEFLDDIVEIQKKAFGKNWVFGPWRNGRLVTSLRLFEDLSLSYEGAPRDVVSVTEEGFLMTDGGELFQLDYENGQINLQGRVELF